MHDSHFHLDETIVSLPGLIASMDRAGIEKTMLIPNVCPPLEHLGVTAKLVMPFFRRLIHGREGYLHRAASSMYSGSVKGDGTVDLLGKKYPVKIQPDNDAVIRAVAAYPNRFLGLCWVNPRGPLNPVEEALRCLAKPGMVGVKAHPFWHNYPMAELREAASLCVEKGVPMLIHMGAGPAGDFAPFHREFPNLVAVYAHCGIPYSRKLCEMARENKNVYVDFSNLEYVDARAARACISIAGADSCLFGTDGPYMRAANDGFDYKPFLAMLDSLGLSDTDREKVARKNFEKVFHPN